jgi:beta-exotoxin I transport system permease protein
VSGLLAKAWRDQRRTLIGFGIGLVLIETFYAAFYPSIRDSAASLQSYLDSMPEGLRELFGTDFASPDGYLRGQLFGELGPILFLIVAIGAGARSIAGEEEARTLDLVLVTPARRWQVLASKAAAVVATMVVLGLIAFVTVLAVGPLFDLRVNTGHLAWAMLLLTLFSIAFGAIAFAVGAATGRRALAISIAAAVAVGMFIINALGVTVASLEPLRPLSLFRWFTSPPLMSSEIDLRNVLVFLGVSAVAYLVAHLRFVRRDLAS